MSDLEPDIAAVALRNCLRARACQEERLAAQRDVILRQDAVILRQGRCLDEYRALALTQERILAARDETIRLLREWVAGLLEEAHR